MLVIGFSGKAGSGKSTVAERLADRLGFVVISLADPIKRACGDWFGWNADRLWGASDNRNAPDPRFNGLTARKALQYVGTEVGRELYRDVWVEYAFRTAQKLGMSGVLRSLHYSYSAEHGLTSSNVPTGPKPAGVVIPDVRFQNEVDAFRSHPNAKLIRIKRPNTGLGGTAGSHASEQEQDAIPDGAFDAVIHNSSDLERLYEVSEQLVRDFIGTARH
jgi:hypothetical protein